MVFKWVKYADRKIWQQNGFLKFLSVKKEFCPNSSESPFIRSGTITTCSTLGVTSSEFQSRSFGTNGANGGGYPKESTAGKFSGLSLSERSTSEWLIDSLLFWKS